MASSSSILGWLASTSLLGMLQTPDGMHLVVPIKALWQNLSGAYVCFICSMLSASAVPQTKLNACEALCNDVPVRHKSQVDHTRPMYLHTGL